MGYLPSKNFIALVSAALVILFTGWFVSMVWNSAPETLKSPSQAAATSFLAAYQNANRDTDNDGLKDWEEILWKTDPNKADTDGDGALDGPEVKDGRDPMVAGHKLANSAWNDVLESKIEENAKSKEGKTITKLVAEEFASNYFLSKGVEGDLLQSSAKSDIANSLSGTIEKEIAAYKDAFSLSNLKISQNSGGEFAKTYLNKIGALLEKEPAGTQTAEPIILRMILEENNFEKTKLFDPYIEAYKKLVADLKNVSAPTAYKELHLELINALNNTRQSVEFMRGVEKDPAGTMIGIRLYITQGERIKNFLISMKDRIDSENITFLQNEGGYFFNKYTR
ncbi:MAG: hypothetical protein Q8Q46_02065 [Candidatus Giovannonibacteria bacterium]|nr:hypothetical protein [Candidatus Giovannonibacteria bacterium]